MVTIRKATLKDIDCIWTVYLEFIKDGERNAKRNGPAAAANWRRSKNFKEDVLRQQRKNIQNKEGIYLLAEDEGAIVGYSYAYIIKPQKGFLFQPPKHGLLDMNFVLPKYRGRGIGAQMIKLREQWLKQHGCKYAYLHVQEGNPAIELDMRSGYRLQGHTLGKRL